MLSKIFKKISSNKYKKYLRKAGPLVAEINRIEEEYQSLSEDQLKAKTEEFRERYRQRMDDFLATLSDPESDKGQIAIEEKNQEILDSLLPEAFAAAKNAARRLCGREVEFTGTTQKWEMVHFDVQLMGGMALHDNKIAEMATGEGKTLVATLPLYLNALTGRNCQLVTVNDYLARRDSEWMGHLFNMLGLTVGCIQNQMRPPERRDAYARDITYGTASEFGFDYLRDNGMATRVEDQVQRDHYFCIIDEVDSILIDEARTPLIISGPVKVERDLPFEQMKPPIQKIVRQQVKLCNQLVSEAQEEIKTGDWRKDPASPFTKLLQVRQGAPRNKQLMRLLQDGEVRNAFEKFELEMQGDFNKKQFFQIKEELYYVIDEKGHHADLTEKGRKFLKPDDPSAFLLPELSTEFVEIDKRKDIDQKEREKLKADIQEEYERITEEIHTISQLLKAYTLYLRDEQYVVENNKVIIVDESTGRKMPGRRWSDGLHQAVEAKEGATIEAETRTFATITIQNYFRMYEKLAGMTGTAETEVQEFRDIYRLDVVVVPTNRPITREDDADVIFRTRTDKYKAVVEEIGQAKKKGQPVLVGTTSVDDSELLSRYLKRQNITHSVLNAKYHEKEAEIIANAGQPASVTIATNMAGRGTDIKLGEGVKEAGGLYVLGTERHTSRRVDRQLRGRSGRQGDPGYSRFFISLEDNLLRLFGQDGVVGNLLKKSVGEGEVPLPTWVIENAQKRVEEQRYTARKQLLEYDDVLNHQRTIIYEIRNDAIKTDNPREAVFELVEEELDSVLAANGFVPGPATDESGVKELLYWANHHFPISLTDKEVQGKPGSEVRELILERINEAYKTKESVEDPEALKGLERYLVISAIDRHWQEHLTAMDDLRQAVGLSGYGQQKPIQVYKKEALTYFEKLMAAIRTEVASRLFRSGTNLQAFENMLSELSRKARATGPADAPNPNTASGGNPAERAVSPVTATGPAGDGGGGTATRELPKVSTRRVTEKVGRNDPCPCGSGKKFKKCCGAG